MTAFSIKRRTPLFALACLALAGLGLLSVGHAYAAEPGAGACPEAGILELKNRLIVELQGRLSGCMEGAVQCEPMTEGDGGGCAAKLAEAANALDFMVKKKVLLEQQVALLQAEAMEHSSMLERLSQHLQDVRAENASLTQQLNERTNIGGAEIEDLRRAAARHQTEREGDAATIAELRRELAALQERMEDQASRQAVDVLAQIQRISGCSFERDGGVDVLARDPGAAAELRPLVARYREISDIDVRLLSFPNPEWGACPLLLGGGWGLVRQRQDGLSERGANVAYAYAAKLAGVLPTADDCVAILRDAESARRLMAGDDRALLWIADIYGKPARCGVARKGASAGIVPEARPSKETAMLVLPLTPDAATAGRADAVR